MSPAVRPAAIALCAVLAIAAVGQARERGERHERAAASGAGLEVTAGAPVSGLYPGSFRPLTFRITNRFGRRIVVRSLRTAVTVAGGTGACRPREAIAVRVLSTPRFAVRPGRTKIVSTSVSMPHTAPDACQGARFRIALTAEATR